MENQSAQEFRVKGGSQRISQKLVSKIGPHRVLLKHAATKIDQTDSSVDVGLKNCLQIAQKLP